MQALTIPIQLMITVFHDQLQQKCFPLIFDSADSIHYKTTRWYF